MAAENKLHCVLGKLTDGVVHPADTGFDGDDDGQERRFRQAYRGLAARGSKRDVGFPANGESTATGTPLSQQPHERSASPAFFRRLAELLNNDTDGAG